ncbi:MAG: hypothetical protein HQ513_14995 [Rhodospirillales bacterium]|nr:hypothetical protein [Rhodospirillales bacterium]
MKFFTISLLLTGMLGLCFFALPAAAQLESNFEIMKATPDKVWRLNKTTGEIAVCSLDGERLVCTSSSEAMRPPALTYEERQAEKKRLGEESQAEMKRLEKQKNVKEMEFLDRALNAIRSLFEASLESKSDTAQ